MHGGELIEEVRVDPLQARLEEFESDAHGERAADQEHQQGEQQVQGADILVVGGGNPAHQPRWWPVIVVIVVRVVGVVGGGVAAHQAALPQ